MKDLLVKWYACNTHLDHWMEDWQGKWECYAPDPILFGQDATASDIGPETHKRFWQPVRSVEAFIYLQCPGDVVKRLRGYGLHTGYMRDAADLDIGLNAVNGNVNALRKWVDVIRWEASSSDMLPCLWHPNVPIDLLRTAYSGPITEVSGQTLEECLSKLSGVLKSGSEVKSYVDTYLVLLRSPRNVFEELRGHGWHGGNWRDSVTGYDNGLRAIILDPKRTSRLREWIDVLQREAQTMPGGLVCAWHPKLRASDFDDTLKVLEIEAETAAEALDKFNRMVKT